MATSGGLGAPAVPSRRRQHELLRSWSTWAMTSILLEPAEVTRVRESGWSGTHHLDAATGKRIVGTAHGLGFGVDEGWHHPREVVAWADVAAIAATVPAEVREQLLDLVERWHQHSRAYPRFAASAEAVGCGPLIAGVPPTPRQEAYLRELEAFEDSGVLSAWEQTRRALDAERLQLHERALAAVLDQGPADLLELLEDHHLEPTAATHDQETPMRIRNYTDQQRAALESLGLPEQFTVICERKTSHSSERVVFEYVEGDRSDSVILRVDDRSRGYLDAGAAVLVARAHQRYAQQARNSMYTEAARAMSGRAAGQLSGWLDTHPSSKVQAWQRGQNMPADKRPALAPPPLSGRAGNETESSGRLQPAHLTRSRESGPAR